MTDIDINDKERAFLGLSPTEDLMRELIVRFRIGGMISHDLFERALNHNRARVLLYMLWGLSQEEKDYRTIDSH
jgi:hypothetical protein